MAARGMVGVIHSLLRAREGMTNRISSRQNGCQVVPQAGSSLDLLGPRPVCRRARERMAKRANS